MIHKLGVQLASVLIATESWAGPGYEASISVHHFYAGHIDPSNHCIGRQT